MLEKLTFELWERNFTITVEIHLLPKIFFFLRVHVRDQAPDKIFKLFLIEFLLWIIPQRIPQVLDMDVLGIDLEPNISHNFFIFVLENFSLPKLLFEIAIKDRMPKQVIPAYPILFLHLESFMQKVERHMR